VRAEGGRKKVKRPGRGNRGNLELRSEGEGKKAKKPTAPAIGSAGKQRQGLTL